MLAIAARTAHAPLLCPGDVRKMLDCLSPCCCAGCTAAYATPQGQSLQASLTLLYTLSRHSGSVDDCKCRHEALKILRPSRQHQDSSKSVAARAGVLPIICPVTVFPHGHHDASTAPRQRSNTSYRYHACSRCTLKATVAFSTRPNISINVPVELQRSRDLRHAGLK